MHHGALSYFNGFLFVNVHRHSDKRAQQQNNENKKCSNRQILRVVHDNARLLLEPADLVLYLYLVPCLSFVDKLEMVALLRHDDDVRLRIKKFIHIDKRILYFHVFRCGVGNGNQKKKETQKRNCQLLHEGYLLFRMCDCTELFKSAKKRCCDNWSAKDKPILRYQISGQFTSFMVFNLKASFSVVTMPSKPAPHTFSISFAVNTWWSSKKRLTRVNSHSC